MSSLCCLLQVVYRDPVRYKLQKTLTIAPEGVYSGQVCSKREQQPQQQQQRQLRTASRGSCAQQAEAAMQPLQHCYVGTFKSSSAAAVGRAQRVGSNAG
jgi:hypothetical protein